MYQIITVFWVVKITTKIRGHQHTRHPATSTAATAFKRPSVSCITYKMTTPRKPFANLGGIEIEVGYYDEVKSQLRDCVADHINTSLVSRFQADGVFEAFLFEFGKRTDLSIQDEDADAVLYTRDNLASNPSENHTLIMDTFSEEEKKSVFKVLLSSLRLVQTIRCAALEKELEKVKMQLEEGNMKIEEANMKIEELERQDKKRDKKLQKLRQKLGAADDDDAPEEKPLKKGKK